MYLHTHTHTCIHMHMYTHMYIPLKVLKSCPKYKAVGGFIFGEQLTHINLYAYTDAQKRMVGVFKKEKDD